MKTIKILLTVFSLTGFSLFAQELPDLPDPPSIFEESKEKNPIQITDSYYASTITELDTEQRNMRATRRIRDAYSRPEGLSENAAKEAIVIESWYGNVEAVKILLENGVDPNSQIIYGMGTPRNWRATPLLNAAESGFGGISVMELLIQSGADTRIGDSKGESPLFKAALKRNLPQVDYLLASNANPNTVSRNGRLLMEAIHHGSTAINNLTSHYGARSKRTIETTKDVLYVIKALISHGARMGSVNNRTALTTCAESCCPLSLLFMLLESGADEYIDNKFGRDWRVQRNGRDQILTMKITAREMASNKGCYPIASILNVVETERTFKEIPTILEDLREIYPFDFDLASI